VAALTAANKDFFMKARKKTAQLLLAISVGMNALPANAVYDPAVHAAVLAVNGSVIGVGAEVAAVAAAVAASSTAIIGAMGLQTVALGTAIKGMNSTVSQMLKESAAQQMNNALTIQSSEMKYQNETRFSPSDPSLPCLVGAVASGTGQAMVDATSIASALGRGGSGGARFSGSKPSSSTEMMKSVLDVAEGKRPAAAPEIEAAKSLSAACGKYADGALRTSACAAAGMKAGGDSIYKNADVRAQSLFDGPQDPKNPGERYTVSLAKDSEEEMAVSAFLSNINSSQVPKDLSAGELGTVGGRKYLDLKKSYDARMSLATYSQEKKRSMAAPSNNPAIIEGLKSMVAAAQAGDPYVSNRLSKTPNWATVGVSPDEMISIEVERRAMNPAWINNTGAMLTDDLQREQVRISAFQNFLMFQGLKESRQQNIMLGAIYASLTRQELLPEMKAARDSAAR
jgi:hypothetical protein